MAKLTKEELDARREILKGRLIWENPKWDWLPEPGWDGLLLDTLDLLDFIDLGPEFRAVQIKEKFGTLRFYWNLEGYSYDSMEWKLASVIVSNAEARSANICEFCGDYGSTRALSWYKTLCRHCLYLQAPEHPDLNGWNPNFQRPA